MQVSLKNPYKLLQVIAQKDLTGCLSITIPQDTSIGWQLYLGGSRLYFATARGCRTDRFRFLWQQMTQDLPVPELSPDKSEYESLYEWQMEHHISLTQFRQIILNLSREALIHTISYDKAYVNFEPNNCIKPVLIAAPCPDLIRPIANHIRCWQKLHANIPSPFSRLCLEQSKVKEFSNFWETANVTIGKASVQNVGLSLWLEILEQKLTIYEICYRLKIEPHVLVLWLHVLIANNTLEISSTSSNSTISSLKSNSLLIACIDDSHTVQRQVKMVLEMSGFQVLGITDPTVCITSLVRQKPALILMDITMPEIDGYELCRMLRQSRHMRNVPIVMFTGRDGFIDRMRATLVGANGYITKPVNADKLIAKVQQLLQNGQISTYQNEIESSMNTVPLYSS